MQIRSNMPLLKMVNNQHKISAVQNKAIARLSSGLRINSAADDASGLTISEGMRAQIRGLERANMNSQDAASYVQTADGVVQEVMQLVQRMRELTVQSLNDTLTDQDRIQLDKEFNQLQESISSMTKNAQYNGELTSVDQHMNAYGMLQGNRYFNGPVQIISGWNDRLTLIAEPDEYEITLPEGNFNNITDLIDEIDTKVYKDYPSIIFDVLSDQSVSVQIENYGDITKVKGPGSFLFYEYELGTPPGMIIGSTDFSKGNKKLEVYEGVNDTLTFYAGSTKIYEFKIPVEGELKDVVVNGVLQQKRAQAFTRDELIDIINGFLGSKGEVDVEAKTFGEQYIAITSDKYVITGLGGNMIEIDGISSFLYDISNTGSVNKTNGVFYGSAYLQPDTMTFEKGKNDTLSIRLDKNNTYVTISLLKESENSAMLTSEEIIERLNEQFEELQLGAEASMVGSRLKIESNYYGDGSAVSIQANSPAYSQLFKREETHFLTPPNQRGQLVMATISGNYGDRKTIAIDEYNNKLSISVNGQLIELELDMGDYQIDDLVAQLNEKLPDDSKVEFGYEALGGKIAISLQSEVPGTLIEFTDETLQSSAFDTLFGGSRMISPTYSPGRTSAPIPPPEGEVGEAQFEKTPAIVTGKVNMENGINVTSENDTLIFMLNGVSATIQLEKGTHYSKDQLIETMNAKFSKLNVAVSAEIRDGYLTLISNEKGAEISFSNVTGLGMERFDNVQPQKQKSLVSEASPSVTAVSQLPNEFGIDSSNDKISFIYVDKNGEQKVELSVPHAEYMSREEFVKDLNEELRSALNNESIRFTISDGKLQLMSSEKGSAFYFKDLKGNLYEQIFQRKDYVFDGYGYNGSTTRKGETYILGRQPLGNQIEIFPNVNEVLTFDVLRGGKKYTIDVAVEPGTYTRDRFITAFNQSLKTALRESGLEEDLMRAQIGIDDSKPPVNYDKSDKFVLLFNEHNDGRNDSATSQIQGVRGTAAYTYFYNAIGEPKPSHVVGITDLSEGAIIEDGVNDEFFIDIDEETKRLTIPAGNYSKDDLLVALNELLTSDKTGLIASYDGNLLKLSNREYGAIPIDGFTGSARDFLFFRTERRENQEELKFQVGANQGQSINYNRIRLSDQLLRINTLTISHRQGAEKAIGRIDKALASLTEKSGYVGAIENRLEHIIRINEINTENLTSAESRIRDADLAKEKMNQIKISILSQTNQTIMMHAKALPENILQLLTNK